LGQSQQFRDISREFVDSFTLTALQGSKQLGWPLPSGWKVDIYLMLGLMLTWFAGAVLQLKAAATHHLIGDQIRD
jgi:hypothetical protein